jgi:hypothetical protein
MDGNINTDFDLPVNNERNNPSVRANVGKGGPLVTLKAERGNIEVKKQ